MGEVVEDEMSWRLGLGRERGVLEREIEEITCGDFDG